MRCICHNQNYKIPSLSYRFMEMTYDDLGLSKTV